MTRPRTLAPLSILLLTLPAALPTAQATDVPEDAGGAEELLLGGCETTYTDWLNSGRITVVRRGTYAPQGYGIDGCRGNGCDDAVTGYFWNGVNAYRDFEMHEVRTYAGCRVSCSVETSAGLWTRHEVEGRLEVDRHENLVNFRCGTEGTSTFLFRGQLIYCGLCPGGFDPDAAVPTLETGDLTI